MISVAMALADLIGPGKVFSSVAEARDFATRGPDGVIGHHCDLDGWSARAVAVLIVARLDLCDN